MTAHSHHTHPLQGTKGMTNHAQIGDLATANSGVAALPMLEVFDVSENRLTGLLPASWTAAKLVELDAHDNALTGPLPASLAQLPRLAYLQLQVASTQLLSLCSLQSICGADYLSSVVIIELGHAFLAIHAILAQYV